jgi:uncharacterized protein YuzE
MKRVNYFDLALLLLLLVISSLFLYSFLSPKEQVGSGRVTIVFKTPKENISSAAKADKGVYFNGVNKEVSVIDVVEDGENLLIKLSANGKIIGEDAIFNGQKIYINQKAEIHDSYFTQGRIVEIVDEK